MLESVQNIPNLTFSNLGPCNKHHQGQDFPERIFYSPTLTSSAIAGSLYGLFKHLLLHVLIPFAEGFNLPRTCLAPCISQDHTAVNAVPNPQVLVLYRFDPKKENNYPPSSTF